MISEQRNYGLDLARALAISLALFIHLYDYFIKVDIGEMWYLGYFAMDIFFALSGFLIGGILIKLFDDAKGVITFSQVKIFLIRRWFRTVPLFYVMLLVNFFAAKYLLHTIDKLDPRYFFWVQNISHLPPSFMGEAWSLSVEEWFYFSFAAGLCLFSVLVKKWRIPAVYKLLVFTFSYIIIFNIIRLCCASHDYNEYNIVIFRLDATAYGVVMAIAYRYFYPYIKSKINTIAIAGVLISAFAILMFLLKPKLGRIYIIYYPLIGIGLSFCILFLKVWSDGLKIKYWFKPINLISRISYSLYLLNMVIIFTVLHFFPVNSFFAGAFGMLITGFIIFIISLFTYRFIETPFFHIRDKYFKLEKKSRRENIQVEK